MPFYNKPKNIRYVDMAIYIDENVRKEDADDELIFEYLYHLAKMLAYKRSFFKESQKYEDFSIYLASKMLIRLKRTDEKVAPIKSILNYMKNVLYPEKVLFERENYKENILTNAEDIDNDSFRESLVRMVDELKIIDFKLYFDNIPKTIYSYVSKIPHKDKAYIENIYISCLLSLLQSMTLSKTNKLRVENLMRSNKLTFVKLNNIYAVEKENSKVYYHVDPKDKQLVDVLVNKLRHIISVDLSSILHENVGSNYSQDVLMSAVYSDFSSNEDLEN